MQLIGKVQGVMMKSYATRVPLAVLDQIARRSVEWLVMAEDLPAPENRVMLATGREGDHEPRAAARHEHARTAAHGGPSGCCAPRATTSSSPSPSTSA